jgi:periplasmic protein TonB
MANETKYYPGFDDLIFEYRNKEYGAYVIRKKYVMTLALALISGILILITAILVPYFNAKHRVQENTRIARVVIAEMANDIQKQEVPPPPQVPPPPPEEFEAVTKYVAPVVVDSVMPNEMNQLSITDEQVETGSKGDAKWVQLENRDDTAAEVPTIVEEMPHFPGGEMALVRYILNSIRYPVAAEKLGIHGKVYVTFIVGMDGEITDVKISESVDPLLDKEALRVVRNLPRWIPGKQRGKPVRVSYTVPINFVLK